MFNFCFFLLFFDKPDQSNCYWFLTIPAKVPGCKKIKINEMFFFKNITKTLIQGVVSLEGVWISIQVQDRR